MLTKHKKVFSDQPGHCKPKLGMHMIKLKPNTVLTRKVPYRLPERLHDEVDKQINEFLSNGLMSVRIVHMLIQLCVYKSNNSI